MQNVIRITSLAATVILGLSLQACQSSQYQETVSNINELSNAELDVMKSEKEATARIRSTARDYVTHIRKYGCGSSIEGMFFDISANSAERNLPLSQKYLVSPVSIHTAQRTDSFISYAHAFAEARLAVGDAAVEKGCLALAAQQYRSVIRILSGPAYAGYRQRAEIGLRDVIRFR